MYKNFYKYNVVSNDIVIFLNRNDISIRHLNGSVLETLTHPSLLITDAFNALYNQAKRRDRDQKLICKIDEEIFIICILRNYLMFAYSFDDF